MGPTPRPRGHRELRADRRAVQGRGHRAVQAVLGDRQGRRGRHPPGVRSGVVTGQDSRAAVEAVWRLESARIIAGLARLVRDVGLAEELAQDALVEALEKWPQTGIPANPGGRLMVAAKHRAIDRLRRDDALAGKITEIGYELRDRQRSAGSAGPADFDEVLDDDALKDDLLRLIFTACHPALSTESRVALTLRVLGGLTTEEIARAFLVPEPTVAQRIVRARRKIATAGIPFRIPAAHLLPD